MPLQEAKICGIGTYINFLAGVYQLVFGLAKFGLLVNFVSHNVVIGFTGWCSAINS